MLINLVSALIHPRHISLMCDVLLVMYSRAIGVLGLTTPYTLGQVTQPSWIKACVSQRSESSTGAGKAVAVLVN